MKSPKLPDTSDTKQRQFAGPVQAEWDFSQCPDDRLYYCWAYEFARESPTLIEHYRHDQKMAQKHSDKFMFDDGGNWHHPVNVWSKHALWKLEKSACVNMLVIAAGFPDAPYVKTKHKPARVKPFVQAWTKQMRLKHLVSDGQLDDFKGLGGIHNILDKLPNLPKSHILRIRWDFSNKELVEAFKVWLKRSRPFKAHLDCRGKSAFKKYGADLKALSAYRLMRTLSVTEAIAHMKKCGRNPLFQKECDWFTARKRAAKVLRQEFNTEPYFAERIG